MLSTHCTKLKNSDRASFKARFFAVFWILAGTTITGFAQENAVVRWNNALLQTIRYRHPGPTIVARALAVTHTCMYDAWTAYDPVAAASISNGQSKRPAHDRSQANKEKAISFAAYRCLTDLFPAETPRYDAIMADFGFDPSDARMDSNTPSGVGNLAASAVLKFRHHDGSNQLGDLHPGAYSDYTGYLPLNDPNHLFKIDRWQPLKTPIPDGGLSGRFLVQKYLTPHWGLVVPFALTSGSQFRPAEGPPSFTQNKEQFIDEARDLLRMSAQLTDEQKMIAEYWADGPASETPPGHWCLFGQFVSIRDRHTLDDDVKMFFVLTNAMLDASVAAWDAKRAFDSVRPVSAIHFLFATQPVQAWGGRFKGTQTIQGAEWQPYQPTVMAATPPFPEFVSGHSTFSAAAAEILKQFTGKDDFGDSVHFEIGASKIEPGLTPRAQLTLGWPTFSAAADQAGLSRRLCGIHFTNGDLAGRAMGRKVATQVWNRASQLFEGKTAAKLPVRHYL
ncbi:MAG TPA: phosphoesterase [Candidatus Angelobacter sp.]|jgi:hypothetical protein|nr:phosphoesterase [Candidatus Angelobacter sp.]